MSVSNSLVRRIASSRVKGRLRSALGSAALCLLVLVSGAARAAQDEWQGVERIVAVGDVHGDYDGYMQVLRDAGIVNKRGKWTGGKTHFVQVGDVPDRGPDTHKILRHLMKLQKQAKRAGGQVHALIGNHEAMNISGDLRYVTTGEFKALTNGQSKRLQDAYWQQSLDYYASLEEPPVIDDAFREKWLEQHPVGFVEHRRIWDPSGEFGKWVVKNNTVIKINDILFLHGGLGPPALNMTLSEINERIRTELTSGAYGEGTLYEAEDGPLWYRGLSRTETPEEAAHLDAILEHFDASHVVLGHTPGYGTIMPRYGAKVLVIDTGIGAYYGSHRASLLVEGGELFTVQRGERVPIPEGDADPLPYFRRMSELEPDVNNLKAVIQRLENPPVEQAETGSSQP